MSRQVAADLRVAAERLLDDPDLYEAVRGRLDRSNHANPWTVVEALRAAADLAEVKS